MSTERKVEPVQHDEPSQPVVSLRNVSKVYGKFVAVDDLSLDVHKGELVCLLGPSGCGKTTTLRMIAGFVEPDGGAVMISGQDVTHLPPYRRDTGMVFQSYGLFPHMTVTANVAFGLESIGMPKHERAQRVDEMLELVELDHLAGRFPAELSGGQQQRVALARALALRPAVLLLDEPFSNLDAQLRVRLREELRNLIDSIDITTLFVTHDQEEAILLSDRIVVMNEGRGEQIGTPEDIYERPTSRFVAEFIGLCTILEGQAYDSEFVSDRGLRLPIKGHEGKALAVVRPEYLKLATGAGAHFHLSGTVERAHYYGAMTRLRVRIGDEMLLMEADFSSRARPVEGQSIDIEIDCSRISLIPNLASAQ
jgi:putative spermidine/putrescine transport system ATP-binding protein